MNASARLVALTQALADPLRLAILQHLMAGPATVSELVALCAATQPNVSNHLALLRERGLVRATRQGRASVYELRDATVAQLVESLYALGGEGAATRKPAHRPTPALAAARICYDHLAGRLGVALFDALVARGALVAPAEPGQSIVLGREAELTFGALGVDLDATRRMRRRFATACLDWTERRPHLGGALGAAIWERANARNWIEREPGGRVLRVTEAGILGFGEWLGIDIGSAMDTMSSVANDIRNDARNGAGGSAWSNWKDGQR